MEEREFGKMQFNSAKVTHYKTNQITHKKKEKKKKKHNQHPYQTMPDQIDISEWLGYMSW